MKVKLFEFNTPLEQLNEVYGIHDKERNRVIIAPNFNYAIKFTLDLTDLDESFNHLLKQYKGDNIAAYSVFHVVSNILSAFGYELEDEDV